MLKRLRLLVRDYFEPRHILEQRKAISEGRRAVVFASTVLQQPFLSYEQREAYRLALLKGLNLTWVNFQRETKRAVRVESAALRAARALEGAGYPFTTREQSEALDGELPRATAVVD